MHTTIDDMEDIWLSLKTTSGGKRLGVSNISPKFETTVAQRFERYIVNPGNNVRYVVWNGKETRCRRQWDRDHEFPRDPYQCLLKQSYKDLLTGILKTFMTQPKKFTQNVVRLQDNLVPPRSAASQGKYATATGVLAAM